MPILICGCCSRQTPITIKIIIINRFAVSEQQTTDTGDLSGSHYVYVAVSTNPRYGFIKQTNIVLQEKSIKATKKKKDAN